MLVIKRNGNKEEFNADKIEDAVLKAFTSCKIFLSIKDRKTLTDFIDSLNNENIDEMSVESIQDLVEKFLCKRWFPVGKAYMLYREHHKQARIIKDKLQYIHKYIDSKESASNLSNTDDNANSHQKNAATLEGELYKDLSRQIQRSQMKDLLAEINSPYRDLYVKDLEHHIIYQHDESCPILKPYTFSSKEVVDVWYGDKHYLTPLDLLYSLVEADEVQEEEDVFCKYPRCLIIKDRNNGYTKVKRLTKKKRHRDLVRVKTGFGEDIVVTDNHPLITDIKNINNTTEASKSLGKLQYKIGEMLSFGKNLDSLDLVKIMPSYTKYQDNYINIGKTLMKRIVEVKEKLGYIVGFFIGDGNYDNTLKYITFTQKNRNVLDTINSYLYEVFGIIGRIQRDSNHKIQKYQLIINNPCLYELFRGYFKIQDRAQNKTLPINILDFCEDFSLGILAGLIDSDGTVSEDSPSISIRLSSRAAILQCTALFRHFGYSVGNTMCSMPFSDNLSYKTNYTIWGVSASKREEAIIIPLSFKIKKLSDAPTKCMKYHKCGGCTITYINTIESESAFLKQNEYIYDVTTESHTFALNNILVHNCSAYTLYPLLVDGTTNVDGSKNHAPKHLSSFCGQFQNLVFLLSAQMKGAGAYGEFFNFFSYFCEKEWGKNYWQKADLVITNEFNQEQKTIGMVIDQYFQSVTHYINQPAGNRGYQSPFTNFNVFDSYYWHTMFGDFYFPDGTQPHWEAVNWLQKRYMRWLNEERKKTLLTFPVMTVCCLTDGKDVLDKEYKDFITTQWAEGDSFFVYLSENADSISSCCRLRNEISENTFSSTTGLTGVQTGSCNVMTLNLNRIVQDWFRINGDGYEKETILGKRTKRESLRIYLESILLRVYDYQKAYKTGLYKMDRQGMFPQTKAGYINFDKLYCTIGVNGINEAARFLGLTVGNNKAYMDFVSWLLGCIKEYNREHAEKKFKYNLELVPAESLGVKNYNWDKGDGYLVPEDENLYNSYIYDAHDDTSVLDKIAMQGDKVAKSIDGGQASHINLQDNLSKEQYTKLLEYAVKVGNSYITFNVPQTQCDDCGLIAKHPFYVCPKCGSKNVTLWTRIIGYLTPMKSWSNGRQQEGKRRTFTKKDDVC